VKKSILFISLLVFAIAAKSQNGEEYNPYSSVKKDSLSSETKPETKFDLEKAKKMSFSLEFGTGIESYMNNSSAFYTYTAPSLRYALTKKLSVRVGVMMMNVNANNLYYLNSEGLQKTSGNFLQNYFYTAADYYATDRLRITGEILYGNNLLQNSKTGFNMNPKAFSIGATYKINDFMEIGIKIGQRQNQQGIFIPGGGFNNTFNGSGF
jgi:hypothetical protein